MSTHKPAVYQTTRHYCILILTINCESPTRIWAIAALIAGARDGRINEPQPALRQCER